MKRYITKGDLCCARRSGELSAQRGFSGQRRRAPETPEGRTLLIPAPGLWLRAASLQLRHLRPDRGRENRAGTGGTSVLDTVCRLQILTLSLLQALYPLSLINGSLDEAKGASAVSRNLAARQGYTVVAGNNHNTHIKAFSYSFTPLVTFTA